MEERLFKLDLLPKLTLERIDSPSGYRVYRTPAGDFPSVTTILDKNSDKSGLHAWRERVGKEVAEGISHQAKRRGTAVHSLCESYLLNQQPFGDPVAYSAFKSIRKVLDGAVDCVYGAEFMLYSEALWTAGTCDAFVKLTNGKNCVIDFKTLRKMPKEDSEKIRNYKLQTTVYAMMLEELYKVECPLCLVICSVDHDAPAVFPFRNDYYREQVREMFSRPI